MRMKIGVHWRQLHEIPKIDPADNDLTSGLESFRWKQLEVYTTGYARPVERELGRLVS